MSRFRTLSLSLPLYYAALPLTIQPSLLELTAHEALERQLRNVLEAWDVPMSRTGPNVQIMGEQWALLDGFVICRSDVDEVADEDDVDGIVVFGERLMRLLHAVLMPYETSWLRSVSRELLPLDLRREDAMAVIEWQLANRRAHLQGFVDSISIVQSHDRVEEAAREFAREYDEYLPAEVPTAMEAAGAERDDVAAIRIRFHRLHRRGYLMRHPRRWHALNACVESADVPLCELASITGALLEWRRSRWCSTCWDTVGAVIDAIDAIGEQPAQQGMLRVGTDRRAGDMSPGDEFALRVALVHGPYDIPPSEHVIEGTEMVFLQEYWRRRDGHEHTSIHPA